MADTHDVRVDHIGIAVPSRTEALTIYRDGLGLAVLGAETVESQGVHVVKLDGGGPVIELLEPIAKGEGPIGKFLASRGPGVHHICLRVDDIVAAAKRMEALGYKLIGERPSQGADGKLVWFLHPKTTLGTLIELSQDGAADGVAP